MLHVKLSSGGTICHSESAAAGEESPLLRQSVAEEEILRGSAELAEVYAQDDNRDRVAERKRFSCGCAVLGGRIR